MKNLLLLAAVGTLCATAAQAQTAVQLGKGSYASEPPAYKAWTPEHAGCASSKMLTRKIYCEEGELGPENGGRPIPTNDWWTDVINNQYSGALWSYPAMLRTGDYGVQICYPTYWADAGKEVKSRTNVTVGAVKYASAATIARDWGDWHLVMAMPSSDNSGAELQVTAAHGVPFTWIEATGLTPQLSVSESATEFGRDNAAGHLGLRIGSDLYGIWYPAGVNPVWVEGYLQFPGAKWLSVGLLTAERDLADFDNYATCAVRKTTVTGIYDEKQAKVISKWHVENQDLRDGSTGHPVLQGFIPHTYKYDISKTLIPANREYLSPRGQLKLYTSATGDFETAVRFSGMMPFYASPAADNADPAISYKQEIMDALMTKYADEGTFGSDTYWGGKGLTQMALNMTFAKQSGNMEVYETSKAKLRAQFENWFSYTPGEDGYFFSYYPRWGAMLGFNVSYDSDAFNDHHFHYGYFTYAAALLCMEDKQFAEDYGEILTLIAKDYANWDRTDTRFPYFRTLDPWCGHSWAGGLGDPGNDNGNGQESTSEAMQGWGGVYLLGEALGNKEMRDAGLWGWNTEARATREYWYDVDAPRPVNAGGREAWSGKNDRQGNYDYTEYPYAYNSNITGKGIGWWTWFGGDPLYMHGIQWMPLSPALDYLSWDTDFVAWAYRDMMSGANSDYAHSWFEDSANKADGSNIEAIAKNDWGNVTLAYMQRANPAEAARIFQRAYDENYHIATAVSTGHISYYVTQHHLTYGEQQFDIWSDYPTASVFKKDGVTTYMVYNDSDRDRVVNFYDANGALVKSVNAPARKLAAVTRDPEATEIEVSSSEGLTVPHGASTLLSARVLDQYGAGVNVAEPTVWTVTPASAATVSNGSLQVNAANGTKFTVTAACAGLTRVLDFTANEPPYGAEMAISGAPEYLEKGITAHLTLTATDQYGQPMDVSAAKWEITRDGKTVGQSDTFASDTPGVYKVTATLGDRVAETELFVTPPMPRVAPVAVVSSSEENDGSKTANISDGKSDTRWGSQHTADEWVYLDLGRDCLITNVSLNWEAAYATDYDIQLAPDGALMARHTGTYAGGEKTVDCVAEDQWITAAEVRGNSHAGVVNTPVNATGRYVRMKGITRALQYGYSIYEFEACGLYLDAASDMVLGIDLDIPSVIDQGEPVSFSSMAYRLDKSSQPVEVTLSEADGKPFTLQGNMFTPLSYGVYNIVAAYGDTRTTVKTFVNEGVQMSEVLLTPSEVTVYPGQQLTLQAEAHDQFGGLYPLDPSKIKVEIKDAKGNAAGTKASYDLESGEFTSNSEGTYSVWIDGVKAATVTVAPFSSVNLALRKTATASNSVQKAANAVDGDNATRWETEHADPQWIKVDLDGVYNINKVVLNWENASARDFTIETSIDGDYWNPVYTLTGNAQAALNTITLPEIPAGFVRLVCNARQNDGWGYSLYELEVYGSGYADVADDRQAPVIEDFSVSVGQRGNAELSIRANDEAGTVFYTLQVTPQGRNSLAVGETLAFTTASEETLLHVVTGLEDGTPYVATLTASDLFGNSRTETLTFTGVLRDMTNVALGKPATSSTGQANLAFDGNPGTRWESVAADPQWVVVDLENTYSIYDIEFDWEGAYAKAYTIEVSADGDTWYEAYSTDDCKGGQHVREQVLMHNFPARYIRFNGSQRATGYGYSFWEMEVYGEPFDYDLNTYRAPELAEDGTAIALVGDEAVVTTSATHPGGVVFYTVEFNNTVKNVVARSGEPVALNFGQLAENQEYELNVKAADAFGNAASTAMKYQYYGALTGIEGIYDEWNGNRDETGTEINGQTKIYTLQGIRLRHTEGHRGLYIIDGRKRMIP